jgi:hypothetical protein
MRGPTRLGGTVPGCRTARVLRDPNGAAARLQSEARRFRWSSVRGACDAYVVEQVVGWAQHVAKLLRTMETGERETALVQRGLLANRIAFLRALNLEYLWGTENGLWERVAERAGLPLRPTDGARNQSAGLARELRRRSASILAHGPGEPRTPPGREPADRRGRVPPGGLPDQRNGEESADGRHAVALTRAAMLSLGKGPGCGPRMRCVQRRGASLRLRVTRPHQAAAPSARDLLRSP